ncbi:MAG: DUF1684 domain-containing protein [Candidatus Sulfotelmatobacter sp.]
MLVKTGLKKSGLKKTGFLGAAASVLLGSVVLFAGTRGSRPAAPDAAYVQSFEKWKAEETDDLKQNWLPLAGLYWLKPGANSFGAAADNAVVFPKGPAHAGEFDLEGKEVTIKMLAGAHATLAGKPLATDVEKLEPDISGHASVVEMGTLEFHVIVRGQRVGIRLKDNDSAAVRHFHGLMFYPLNMNYRVTASWEPSDGKETVDVPNVLGDVIPVPVAGTVVFKINGQEQRLTALGGNAANGLSFVFNDLTAKSEDTYPGGRFLDTDPVRNGTVVLDFNRAYNPPCAVTPYATCPLAPKENRLAVAIPAGERFNKAAHGHH